MQPYWENCYMYLYKGLFVMQRMRETSWQRKKCLREAGCNLPYENSHPSFRSRPEGSKEGRLFSQASCLFVLKCITYFFCTNNQDNSHISCMIGMFQCTLETFP